MGQEMGQEYERPGQTAEPFLRQWLAHAAEPPHRRFIFACFSTCASNAEHRAAFPHFQRRLNHRSTGQGAAMRGDPTRHAAIRKVDELFRRFVAALCSQFTTSAEELVQRAEKDAPSNHAQQPQAGSRSPSV
jgi:hypothetical protein